MNQNETAPGGICRPTRLGLVLLALLAFAGSIAALLLTGAEEEAAAQGATRPNVVVIMTDDQDFRSVRVMRNVKRKLARRGTSFENSFATFPLCCPSRASFLTGQYAHNHGVLGNKPPRGGYTAFREAGSLPVAMQRSGYRTGFVGKYLNQYGLRSNGSRRAVPRGWDAWRALLHSSANAMYGYELNENGRVRRYGSKRRHYQTDLLGRKAARFIATSARRSAPFFLTLSTLAPHLEANRRLARNPRPAPRHRKRFRSAALRKLPSFNEANVSDKPAFIRRRPRLDRRVVRVLRSRNQDRLASLLAVDDAVGRILNQLRRTGELGNTIVIFTSDNGLHLGEHRLKGKNSLYEESVRVPLVIRGPGVPSGRSRSQVVGNIDLAPTILDATGAQPLLTMDGRSLLPLARSATTAADRDILLEDAGSDAVRTPRYMYAEHANGESELYDLREDPFQLRSRHAAPGLAGVRAELAARLRQLRRCSGAACQ